MLAPFRSETRIFAREGGTDMINFLDEASDLPA
jgi:hypothetical protein